MDHSSSVRFRLRRVQASSISASTLPRSQTSTDALSAVGAPRVPSGLGSKSHVRDQGLLRPQRNQPTAGSPALRARAPRSRLGRRSPPASGHRSSRAQRSYRAQHSDGRSSGQSFDCSSTTRSPSCPSGSVPSAIEVFPVVDPSSFSWDRHAISAPVEISHDSGPAGALEPRVTVLLKTSVCSEKADRLD